MAKTGSLDSFRRSKLRRFSASLTAVFFLITSVVLPAPARAQSISLSQDLEVQGVSGFLPLADFPAELGTILESFQPASGQGPFIVHIQDAHSNVDGQQKIREILHWLEKQNQSQGNAPMQIAIEGTEGALHPEYLDLFPKNPDVNESVVRDLAEKGEIGGPELFSWDLYKEGRGQQNSQRAAFVGAEDPALYRENLKTFRTLLFNADEIETLLSGVRANQEVLQSRLVSPELRDFLKERQRRKFSNYGQGQRENLSLQILTYFTSLINLSKEKLEIDLSDRFEQVRFPNLSRLEALRRFEGRFNREKAEKEKKDFLKKLESKASKEDAKFIAQFSTLDQVKNPRRLAEAVWAFAKAEGLNPGQYREFWLSAGEAILRNEVEPSGMMSEMGQLEQWLIEKMAINEQEKQFVRLLDDTVLFEKLLRLELTDEEYADFMSRKTEVLAAVTGNSLAAIAKTAKIDNGKGFSVSSAAQKQLNDFAAQGLAFYEGARLRDAALVGKAIESAKDSGSSVLVAGGFHTVGLTALMKERGAGYVVIMPRITKAENRNLYLDVMKDRNADVSNYFSSEKLSKQEALFFKQMIEVAAPELSQNGGVSFREIGGKIAESINNHPVLSGALKAEAQSFDDHSVMNVRVAESETPAELTREIRPSAVPDTLVLTEPGVYRGMRAFVPRNVSGNQPVRNLSQSAAVTFAPAGLRISVQSTPAQAPVRSEVAAGPQTAVPSSAAAVTAKSEQRADRARSEVLLHLQSDSIEREVLPANLTPKKDAQKHTVELRTAEGQPFVMEFSEGGNVTVDIAGFPVVGKSVAMKNFIDSNKFDVSKGFYFGNQNQTPDDRDADVATVPGSKVVGVDENQKNVIKGVMPVKQFLTGADEKLVGPDATLAILKKWLDDHLANGTPLPQFLGFDVDDTILGLKPDKKKEEFKDRAELLAILARYAALGVRLAFFSDNETDLIKKRIGKPLSEAIAAQSEFTGPVKIDLYTSKMIIKTNGEMTPGNPLAYMEDKGYEPSQTKRLTKSMLDAIVDVIGYVREDEAGNVTMDGPLGWYYSQVTKFEGGKYLYNDALEADYGFTAGDPSPFGNYRIPNVKFRDEIKVDGNTSSASMVAIEPMASRPANKLTLEKLVQDDLRRGFLLRVVENFRKVRTIKKSPAVSGEYLENHINIDVALSVREAGEAALDIVPAELTKGAPTKFDAAMNYTAQTSLKTQGAVYIGANSLTPLSRDGVIAANASSANLPGLIVYAADSNQDVEFPKGIKGIGSGPSAAMVKLKEILEQKEVPPFVGLSIENALLQSRPQDVQGSREMVRESLAEYPDRLETIARLIQKGIPVVFFSDIDTAVAKKNVAEPLRNKLREWGVKAATPVYFYTSGVIHKLILNPSKNWEMEDLDQDPYTVNRRMPFIVRRNVEAALGSVWEDAQGRIQHTPGLLWDYYSSITVDRGGKRVLRQEVLRKYPNLLLPETSRGNLRPPVIQFRDEAEDGSVSMISISPLISATAGTGEGDNQAQLFSREQDLRGQFHSDLIGLLSTSLTSKRSEVRAPLDNELLNQTLDEGKYAIKLTENVLRKFRERLGVDDLVGEQRVNFKNNAEKKDAIERVKDAIIFINRRLTDLGRGVTIENVTEKQFAELVGVRPVVVAAGFSTRFSSVLHKTMARGGLKKTNLGYALEGAYQTPGVLPTVVVGVKIIGLLVKDEYLTGKDKADTLDDKLNFGVDLKKVLDLKLGHDRLAYVRPETLDINKVRAYFGLDIDKELLSDAEIIKKYVHLLYSESYGHGNHVYQAGAVLDLVNDLKDKAPYVQVAFGEMSPSKLRKYSNPSYITYLAHLGSGLKRDASGKVVSVGTPAGVAGGKPAGNDKYNPEDHKNTKQYGSVDRGNFFYDGDGKTLIAYVDWVHIPHKKRKNAPKYPFYDEVWKQFSHEGVVYSVKSQLERLKLFKEGAPFRYDGKELAPEIQRALGLDKLDPVVDINRLRNLKNDDVDVLVNDKDKTISIKFKSGKYEKYLEEVRKLAAARNIQIDESAKLIDPPSGTIPNTLESVENELTALRDQYKNDPKRLAEEVKKIAAGNPFFSISRTGYIFTQDFMYEAMEALKNWSNMPETQKQFWRDHFAVVESEEDELDADKKPTGGKIKRADLLISTNTGILTANIVTQLRGKIDEEFNGDKGMSAWLEVRRHVDLPIAPAWTLGYFWRVDPKDWEPASLAWTLFDMIPKDKNVKAEPARLVYVGQAPSSIKDSDKQADFSRDMAKQDPSSVRSQFDHAPLSTSEKQKLDGLIDALKKGNESRVKLREVLRDEYRNEVEIDTFRVVVSALLAMTSDKKYQMIVINKLLDIYDMPDTGNWANETGSFFPSGTQVQVLINQLLSEAIDAGAIGRDVESLTTDPDYAAAIRRLRNHFQNITSLKKKDEDYVLKRLAQVLAQDIYDARYKTIGQLLALRGRGEDQFRYRSIVPQRDTRRNGDIPSLPVTDVLTLTGGSSFSSLWKGVLERLRLFDTSTLEMVSSSVSQIDDGGNTYTIIEILREAGFGVFPPIGDSANSIRGLLGPDLDMILGNEARLNEKNIPAGLNTPMAKGVQAFIAKGISNPGVSVETDFFYFSRLMLEAVRLVDGVNAAITAVNAAKGSKLRLLPVQGASARNLLLMGMLVYNGLLNTNEGPRYGASRMNKSGETPALSSDNEGAADSDVGRFSQALADMVKAVGLPRVEATLTSFDPKTLYAVSDSFTLNIAKPNGKKDDDGPLSDIETILLKKEKNGDITLTNPRKMVRGEKGEPALFLRIPVNVTLGKGNKVNLSDALGIQQAKEIFVENRGGEIILTIAGVEWKVQEGSTPDQLKLVQVGNESEAKIPTWDGTGRDQQVLAADVTAGKDPNKNNKGLFTLPGDEKGDVNVYLVGRVTKRQTHITETVNYGKIDFRESGYLNGLGDNGTIPASQPASSTVRPNQRMLQKIERLGENSLVAVGPGSFLTSLVPHFDVAGIPEALTEANRRKAKSFVILNGTYDNETVNHGAVELLEDLEAVIQKAASKNKGKRLGGYLNHVIAVKVDDDVEAALQQVPLWLDDANLEILKGEDRNKTLDAREDLAMKKVAKQFFEATNKTGRPADSVADADKIQQLTELLSSFFPALHVDRLRTDPSKAADAAKKARGVIRLTNKDIEAMRQRWPDVKVITLGFDAFDVKPEAKRGKPGFDYRVVLKPEKVADALQNAIRPRSELREPGRQEALPSARSESRIAAVQGAGTTQQNRAEGETLVSGVQLPQVRTERWEAIRDLTVNTESIYAEPETLAAELGVEVPQALALILREILGAAQAAGNSETAKLVRNAAAEALGEFAPMLLNRTGDKPVHILKRVSPEQLKNGDLARLLALLNIARGGQDKASFFVPVTGDAAAASEDLMKQFRVTFDRLGAGAAAADKSVTIKAVADAEGDRELLRVFKQAVSRIRAEKSSMGLVDSMNFLKEFGYVADLARLDQEDMDLNTAILFTAALLKEDLNHFNITSLREELEKRGGVAALVRNVARLIETLKRIEVSA